MLKLVLRIDQVFLSFFLIKFWNMYDSSLSSMLWWDHSCLWHQFVWSCAVSVVNIPMLDLGSVAFISRFSDSATKIDFLLTKLYCGQNFKCYFQINWKLLQSTDLLKLLEITKWSQLKQVWLLERFFDTKE